MFSQGASRRQIGKAASKIGLVFSNDPPSMSRLNFSGRVEAHHPADQEPAFSCIAASGSGKILASRQRS
jgi:hypothetical protein